MASLRQRPNGTFEIRFFDLSDKRQSLFLPRVTLKQAEGVTRLVERLTGSAISGIPIDNETAKWLRDAGDGIRQKLAKFGLINLGDYQGPEAVPLAEFIDRYISGRSDAKQSSKIVWNRCRRLMVRFFGESKRLSEIGIGQAKDFRRWMLTEGMGAKDSQKPGPLAENTARKMSSVAAQFFADAIDRGLIDKNPFTHKDIPRTTRENRNRDHFITRSIAEKVLAACPDAEWKLLFALSRYGGLRCPSEHLALTWGDVLWNEKRIVVTVPKLEHIDGKGTRVIPLFPELQPYLDAAWDAAEPGAEFVIARYRSRAVNLRTQLQRIIKAAGVEPWPKLWHNLRASRQTELAQEFPEYVVCKWIGNSREVAARHYLQVTDEHFTKATVPPSVPPHVTEPAEYSGTGRHKRAKKSRVLSQDESEAEFAESRGVDVTGPEQLASNGRSTRIRVSVPRAVPPLESTGHDAELVDLNQAWPHMTREERARVMAVVRAVRAAGR